MAGINNTEMLPGAVGRCCPPVLPPALRPTAECLRQQVGHDGWNLPAVALQRYSGDYGEKKEDRLSSVI